MRLLDSLIHEAKQDARKRTRRDWTEEDYRIALDMRLTGVEAADLLGCSAPVVNSERREWVHEW